MFPLTCTTAVLKGLADALCCVTCGWIASWLVEGVMKSDERGVGETWMSSG